MPRSANPVAAPVERVTVLEDRARVVRRARARVDAGRTRIQVDDVAPVLADRTLGVALADPVAGAQVVDARVIRRAVFDPVDADGQPAGGSSDRAALVLELARLDQEIERMAARQGMLVSHAGGLDQVAALAGIELAEDAAWGRDIDGEWSDRLAQLRTRERDLRGQVVDLEIEIDAKARERERVRRRIEYLTSASSREWASIEIEIAADKAVELSLEIVYVVPGACWRPCHTARLDASGDRLRVHWRTDACVWQNTGEAWTDAEIELSTERPSLGTEPPELTSDVLAVRRRSDVVQVERRDQRIQTTGLGGGQSVLAELPGIDDGGATLALRGTARASVPSDGRPYRVPIGEFSVDATGELVAFPELTGLVVFKTLQLNAGAMPLLAGPVDLVRDSGLCGRTSILFVAAGERFELGWGPEPELRVHRVEETSDERTKMLSSWIERTHKVTIRLSNIGGRERTVTVAERVPVSEIEKVEIEVDGARTTGGRKPDADGIVMWTVALAPFGHSALELAYDLRKQSGVVGV